MKEILTLLRKCLIMSYFKFKSLFPNKNRTKNINKKKSHSIRLKEVEIDPRQSDRTELKYALSENAKVIIVLRN